VTRGAILHRGVFKPLFGDFPGQLASTLGVPIVEDDHEVDLGLVLAWDGPPPRCRTFIPFPTIVAARDKREQARRFQAAGVSIPESRLYGTFSAAKDFAVADRGRRWLLKWPLGTGSVGHAIIDHDTRVTPLWNAPFLIQEFIELEHPVVHRMFGCAGEVFGFNVRAYPPGAPSSPLVSTHRGAVFGLSGDAPTAVEDQVRRALSAFGLLSTFGCVDLILTPNGTVFVLEVNADGLHQYVNRIPELPGLSGEIADRLRVAFHQALANP
jgi:hypothetical protein